MRVLHIAKANGIGGSERHLFTLLPGLTERGITARICVLEEGDAHRFVDPLRARGVDVVTRSAGPDENPLLIPILARQIRRFRPDVVHTHLLHGDLYGLPAARLLGVPGVRSIHRTVGRRGYRSLERLVGPWAERTIAISGEVARFIDEARIAPPARVRVVRYGIDCRPFAGAGEKRARAREALGLRDGDVAIGIASRLVSGKGHRFLIDAVAAAHRRAPALRLLLAGEGHLRAELERHAAASLAPGVARFLGHVVDVAALLAACDVLVFPTLPEFGEGFGLAALEAIASGCPVVATPMGALPDMVVHGVTGLLVDPGAVDELAGALVRLAGDPELRRILGANAAERARRHFSAAAMVDATIAVYGEVIPQRQPAGEGALSQNRPLPGL